MIPSLSQGQAKQRQIALLEEKYLRYKNPKKPSQFFLVGVNRFQLAQITQNPEHYQQAIKAFTQSITGNPHPEQKYFCYRAKAYNFLGEYEKSVEDLKRAQSLPDSGDIIKNAFMKNVMRQLSKMQTIRSTIEKLKKNKELPDSFLKAFEELTGTSERLLVKVGQHDQKIGQISDNMKFMVKKIQQLNNEVATLKSVQALQDRKSKMNQQNSYKITLLQQKIQQFYENFSKVQSESGNTQSKESILKMVAYTDQEVKKVKDYVKELFQQNVEKMEVRMDEIEFKQCLFVSRTEIEFASIRKQLKKVNFSVNSMEGKLLYVEGEVAENVKQISFIHETLKQSIYPKLQVRKQLETWKQTQPYIYEYANRLYWMINNYLLAYRMVSTGIIDGKEPQPSSFEKYFPRCLKAIATVLSAIPGVSDVMDIIDGIVDLVSFLFESYHEKKFEIKVKIINKFLMENDLESISTQIGNAVIKLCRMSFKQNQIKNFDHQNSKNQKSILTLATEWFDAKVEELISKLEEHKVILEEHVLEKMVLRDVGLFFSVLTNDQKLMQMSLEKAIVAVFEGEENSIICACITKMYEDQSRKDSKQKDSCCLIY